MRATQPAILEAFRVAGRYQASRSELLGVLEEAFDIDDIELMRAVAWALDEGSVKTAFDAFHVVEAMMQGDALHTADEELLATEYLTVRY